MIIQKFRPVVAFQTNAFLQALIINVIIIIVIIVIVIIVIVIIIIIIIIRPVVAFQTNSFLRARPKSSTFVSRLAQTQVRPTYDRS